jgi:hypothetical protein
MANGNQDKQSVVQRVVNAARQKNTIQKSDFSLTQGSSGSESEIASYQAPRALELRSDKPIRLMIPVVETTTTSGGGSQTIQLNSDIVETPNTQNIVVLSNEGSGDPDTVVEPSSVDYAADEFDYDDSSSAEDLEIYYIARDPGVIDVKKVAPESQNSVEEVIFDEASSLLHEQNQFDDPISLDLNQSELQDIVPEDWYIVVEVDLPYDSSLAGQNGLLQVPARFLQEEVDGLDEAVAHDIIDRNNS